MKETAEYSIGKGARSVSVATGEGGDAGEVKTNLYPVIGFDSADKPLDQEEDQESPKVEDGTEQAAKEEDGKDEEGGAEALPEFDPENEEVVAAYDAKFRLESGELDFEGSLSAEFFANQEAGTEGLNEGTYKYLEKAGIPRSTVKKIEAMAATQQDAAKASVQADDAKLFDIAGGADALAAALEWGKKGGYTTEQQERFNTITKGTDLEAKQEAVEALMARYSRANPADKPTLPKRDATKGQGKPGAQGVKPFETREEMRAARNALREGDTKAKALYDARLRASKSFA